MGDISGTLVALSERHDPGGLWKGGSVFAYPSRGTVCNSSEGMPAGHRSRKLRDPILSHKQEVDTVNRKWSESMSSQSLLPHFIKCGSTSSSNIATNWGPCSDLPERMGAISNYSSIPGRKGN